MAIAKTVTFAAVVLACSVSNLHGQDASPGIRLDVQWDPARPTTVSVVLTSDLPTVVQVFKSDLPWGNRYSMILEAVLTRGDVALEKYFPLDDPGDASIQVQPGASLRGEIDLRGRFVDAEKVFGRKEVVLFWTYQLKSQQGTAVGRVGGWLLASPRGAPARESK